MPILPLNHPEPFATTLGVILFPALEEQAMARAFAAHWLAKILRAYPETWNRLSAEVLECLLIDTGFPGDDIKRRWLGGLAAGELLKAVYALAACLVPSRGSNNQQESPMSRKHTSTARAFISTEFFLDWRPIP
jgi:hypothetical protein